jgi:hypothetical protein
MKKKVDVITTESLDSHDSIWAPAVITENDFGQPVSLDPIDEAFKGRDGTFVINPGRKPK